jgi:hypothetical protein
MSEEALKANLDDLAGVEYERLVGMNGHRYSIEYVPMNDVGEVREAVRSAGYEWNPVGRLTAYAHPTE